MLKHTTKNIIRILLLATIISLSGFTSVNAATFSFTPASGFIKVNDTFVIDVLIDTEGEEANKAKAVLTYDPTLVQLTKAERNNSLFQQYPDAEQSTDNTNGVVMLTGFTQSGSGTLYKTAGEPDVFARLTFKAIKAGNLTLDWEFSGTDAPFKSVILVDGSPPQNDLDTKPASASFVIQSTTATNPTPITGVIRRSDMVIAGIAFVGATMIFSGGGVLYNTSKKLFSGKKQTLVRFE